jgi:NADH-quinone oxidoreductase subunit L
LAIAGVPPFAGFFSKEEILLAAYNSNPTIYYIALVTSGLTAFYIFRLYFSIFWNKEAQVHTDHHHKGSVVMSLPLVVLAIGAALAGFIHFGNFVSSDGQTLESHFNPMFSIAPVTIVIIGIAIAGMLYKKQNERPEKIANALSSLYKAAYHKFYIDEIYLFITRKVLFNLVGRPAAWFDRNVVDGIINTTGNTTQTLSAKIKKIQSGKVQGYAIYTLAGVILLAVLFIYLWK